MTKNVDAPPANALHGIGTKKSYLVHRAHLFLFIPPVRENPKNKKCREFSHNTPMSNIAARVLSKPRTCKKPAPAACAASREARDAKNAEESSAYHWIEFNFVVIGFPHERDIQDFQELCRVSRKTARHVQLRDSLISRFLPPYKLTASSRNTERNSF